MRKRDLPLAASVSHASRTCTAAHWCAVCQGLAIIALRLLAGVRSESHRGLRNVVGRLYPVQGADLPPDMADMVDPKNTPSQGLSWSAVCQGLAIVALRPVSGVRSKIHRALCNVAGSLYPVQGPDLPPDMADMADHKNVLHLRD